jgi:hypothetical protein
LRHFNSLSPKVVYKYIEFYCFAMKKK